MQRRIFCLILTAVALGAIGVSTAAAVENTKMLPETFPITFSDKSIGAGAAGEPLFETVGGEKTSCKSAESTGTILTANLGDFNILFLGCTSKGIICTGLGDKTEGSILMLGTFHFWLALLSNKLVAALVLLLRPVHIECSIVLIELRGCLAALAGPIEKLTSTTIDSFLGTNGVSDITEVLPQEATKEIKCTLEVEVAGKAFEQSVEAMADQNENFKHGTEAVTILLMNP